MKTIIEKDVAIIGAGPSGLFAVFEMGMLGYSCAVIDSLPEIGGQLNALYPEKPIFDIPGYPSILAGEIIEKLKEQAQPFKPEYLLDTPLQELSQDKKTGVFSLEAEDHTIQAKVVVVAAGGGMFTPRKPPLDNIEDFDGTNNNSNISVHYSVKDKAQFTDKNVVIAGGGDSATDWAVELASIAKHVHVIHRRAQFRAAEETVNKMHKLVEEGKITLHTPCQLSELAGRDGQLSQVTISDLDENKTELDCDDLLCFFGLIPSLGGMDKWGIDFENKKILVTPSTMTTTRKGILAIGDIVTYDGKLSLILTGFAEGAIAAKSAQGIIEPDKKFRVVYSTSKGVSGL